MVNIKPLLKEKELDALVLVSPKLHLLDPALTYCTGLLDYEKTVYVGGNSQRAYVSSFEVPRAKKDSNVTIIARPKKGFEPIFNKMKGKTIGINGKALPFEIYKFLRRHKIKTKDVSKDLVKMMAIKTPAEITKLKKAIGLTKQMFKLAVNGKREIDIAADMSAFLMRNQAQWSFDPIISYGKNASLPHAKPTVKKKGICLLCDIGASWKGYHADMTRTVVIGSATSKHQEIYDIVLKSQLAGINAAKAGITFKVT